MLCIHGHVATQEMHLRDTCPTHNDKEELRKDWCQQLQECAQVIHNVSSQPVKQCNKL